MQLTNYCTCENSHQTMVNPIVTSQTQILIRSNTVIERVENYVKNYDFIMQPYETIPRIKLRKTTRRSNQNLLQ